MWRGPLWWILKCFVTWNAKGKFKERPLKEEREKIIHKQQCTPENAYTNKGG